MPDKGCWGNGSLPDLRAGMASSGLPLSSIFLWFFIFEAPCSSFEEFDELPAFETSLGELETCNTSFKEEPITITLDPLTTPSLFRVISSFAKPFIITFIIAGGIPVSYKYLGK